MRAYLQQLGSAQDALGAHNDVAVAAAAFRADAQKRPSAWFAAGFLQAHLSVTARAARKALVKAMDQKRYWHRGPLIRENTTCRKPRTVLRKSNGISRPRRSNAFGWRRSTPAAKPLSSGDRERDKATVLELADGLDALQTLFYADRRYKLLVVLQGMDTSGKDGTLRDVFGRMSPLGVRVVGWKATDRGRARARPLVAHPPCDAGSGEIVVFNRSHYEDVLVPVVNRQLTARQVAQRYQQINEFERMLTETRHSGVQVHAAHLQGRTARAPAGAARRPEQTLEVRRR